MTVIGVGVLVGEPVLVCVGVAVIVDVPMCVGVKVAVPGTFVRVCVGVAVLVDVSVLWKIIHKKTLKEWVVVMSIHPIFCSQFLSKSSSKSYQNRMIAFVDHILVLYKNLAVTRTPQEQELLAREIAATDAQIDRLVYELYGLTEAEIKIVEGKVWTGRNRKKTAGIPSA